MQKRALVLNFCSMLPVPGGLDPGRSTPSRVGTPLWNSPVRRNGLARCESTAVSGGVDGELVVFWCVVNILFVLWLSEPVVSLSNATTKLANFRHPLMFID